jgi:hypothetical protein
MKQNITNILAFAMNEKKEKKNIKRQKNISIITKKTAHGVANMGGLVEHYEIITPSINLAKATNRNTVFLKDIAIENPICITQAQKRGLAYRMVKFCIENQQDRQTMEDMFVLLMKQLHVPFENGCVAQYIDGAITRLTNEKM